MTASQIIDQSDLQQIIQLATQEFGIDLESLNMEYSSKVDIVLNIVNQLQAKINNAMIQDKIKTNQVITGQQLYDVLDEQLNEIYVQLTQVYYLMRTYFTGETIDFLEEIDGTLRVVHQQDWIQLLSASKTGYNGKQFYNGIFLLEDKIKDVSIPLSEAGMFSELTRQSEGVIQEVIEAAKFTWLVDGKENRKQNLASGNKMYTDSKGRAHKTIYQKRSKDTNVFAYYSGGFRHQLNLIYEAQEPYKLGHIQERLMAELESYTSIADQLSFITQLRTNEHPVGLVIHNALWNRNNVAGTKEGDLRTLSGQWIQSKRHNEKVISTLQAHNVTMEMKNYLLELKTAFQSSPYRREAIIADLTNKFYKMFSSDLTTINTNLYNKISSQLRLMGQSVI